MDRAHQVYPTNKTETLVLFDLRIPGIAERLHRERAVWQGWSEIEAIDKNHFMLIVRPGGIRRLAA
jgi:hypothetical protein